MKESILHKATDLFLTLGFKSVTMDDLADIARYGARVFLIGESLMRQPDVAQATRDLLANPLTAGPF